MGTAQPGPARTGARWHTRWRRAPGTSSTGWPRWPGARAARKPCLLLLLEVAQIQLTGAKLGASKDVILPGNWEPDVGADPDLDVLRTGLAARLEHVDDYAELFDPYSDAKATAFRLSDDLATIAADLIHGLQHYEAGRSSEALWWWQYSYVNHWGLHGGAALRALHAVVAHARLDVAEDPAVS